MKIRIAVTYRLKPESLTWVFDKIQMEALCNNVAGPDTCVPRIAAWYLGDDENYLSVTNAISSETKLVIKPSHGSQALGVSFFPEPHKTGVSAIKDSINAALAAKADPTEPWMLRGVRPGVVVQELYQSQYPCPMTVAPFNCPLELKLQVLFGNIIFGTVRGYPWQLTVLPDGTIHRWAKSRTVLSSGLPKAWRTQWGVEVPDPLLNGLRAVLSKDWNHIANVSTRISSASKLDELRVDWLLGDACLGPRVGELQYIGAAGNVRPGLQQPLCRAFLLGHKLRSRAFTTLRMGNLPEDRQQDTEGVSDD